VKRRVLQYLFFCYTAGCLTLIGCKFFNYFTWGWVEILAPIWLMYVLSVFIVMIYTFKLTIKKPPPNDI